MGYEEDRKATIKEIHEHAKKLAAVILDDFLAKLRFGKLTFDEAMPYLRVIVTVANDLEAVDLELIMQSSLNQIRSAILQASGTITQIEAFDVSAPQPTPSDRRNNLMNELRSYSDQLALHAMAPLAYLALKTVTAKDRLQAEIDRIRGEGTSTLASVETLRKEIESSAGEARSMVKAIQEASPVAGITVQSGTFGNAASGHKDYAKYWMICTVASSIVSVAALVALVVLKPIDNNATPAVITQYVITRAVGFVVLTYITYWAARNYRAHRHLAIVNDHRQNALRTFETFVKATNDEGTKNAVLLEATRCIFAPVSTGYIDTQDDTSPSRVVEVLKAATGKGEK